MFKCIIIYSTNTFTQNIIDRILILEVRLIFIILIIYRVNSFSTAKYLFLFLIDDHCSKFILTYLHFLDKMIMFKSRVVRIQFMVNGGFKGPVLRHKNNVIKKVEYEKIEFDMN